MLIGDAIAECVFPEDIMLCILTRLPVKSLLRFKSVCKPWCELFATPDFIKTHHHQFSSHPKNESFIIQSLSVLYKETLSLFSIKSNIKELRNLDIPCPQSSLQMGYMGYCNGLVCIGFRPLKMDIIALWNPALRLSKFVQFPEPEGDPAWLTSLGFGYDADGDDFKVVRIMFLQRMEREIGVDVYSSKLDSSKKICKVGFSCLQLVASSDTVNGNPYWIAKVDEKMSLVWCDVAKLEFKTVPLSNLMSNEFAVQCVDWKGSLAVLECSINKDGLECVDVWVLDDGEMIWRKNYTFGPIRMGVYRCLQYSKNGIIMGVCRNGKLFIFDTKSGWVEEIEVGGQRCYLNIYGYIESLAYVKGMK